MAVTIGQIEKFRSAVLTCDTASCISFLEKAETFQFGNVKALLAFHDALLLLEAYPSSLEVYDRANNLLRNFEVLTKRFLRKNRSAAEKLVNSGLRGTEAHGSFTFPLLKALCEYAPDAVFLHSFDEEGKPPGEVLRFFLPKSEAEAAEAGHSGNELMNELYGQQNHLTALVKTMSRGTLPASLRDSLFAELKVYAGIRFNGSIADRSAARGPLTEVFTHGQILKKAEPLEVIRRALPAPLNLSLEQEKKLVLDCMCMLASLNRETDPVSVCDKRGVTFFQLERGVSIALFSMQAEYRLPLDSYIGYVLFKNGVPHAYGGSWLFGNRALFGINIFEPFRGGESALAILQLIRVYSAYYGIDAFSVEPYQFGKDNPEGIASGAYWFYYKMGFRSDDQRLAALAEKEFAKMQKSKSYRSSAATLKKFTESNITWNPNAAELNPDAASVSRATTEFIRTQYNGDREKCIVSLLKEHGLKRGKIADEYVAAFLRFGDTEERIRQLEALTAQKQADERHYNAALQALFSVNQ
jgi:hypothetical protein